MDIKQRIHWSVVLIFTVVLTLRVTLLSLASASPAQTTDLTPSIESTANQNEYQAHYIIFEMQPDTSVKPLAYKQVQLSADLQTVTDQELSRQLQEPNRNSQTLEIALKTSSGETVYQNIVQLPLWLRGEFHPTEAMTIAIDSHLFPLQQQAFVVRLPVIANTSLILRDNQAKVIGRFDLEQLANDTPEIQIDITTQLQSSSSDGTSANRVDLLIMGDGYTAAQQTEFANDVATVAADFFSISPYAEYSNYVITHSLFVASAQAGADHPPYQAGCQTAACCADPLMLSDPLQGTFVNTAFNGRYCTNNIHRLVTVNTSLVLAAAAAVPDWDQILLIVNDPTYGGSGDSISVISMHSSATQIAQHEYGHSFVNLADEYESPFPGYPPCSDITGPACEANVTDVTTRASIKWNPWISPSTPIPTEPEFDPAFAHVVGLFEGARYLTTNMYRSGQDCLMRSLGMPYCQVPSQAYVLTLYDGGWGVPASGIRLIEPDSAVPTTNTLSLWYPYSQIFAADVLQPIGGPPVAIQWLVNGIPDPVTPTNSFTYTPVISDVGSIVEIQLLVQDVTPLVHPAMASASLQNNHIWHVAVGAAPSSVVIDAPLKGIVATNYSFTATVNPTTTTPVTYVWQAADHSPVTMTDGLSNSITFTWNELGPQLITVTVTNAGSYVTGTSASDTHTIAIQAEGSWIYLPFILKQSSP